MDYKEWFRKNGHRYPVDHMGSSFGSISGFSVEEQYQAFKARFLAEQKEQDIKDWNMEDIKTCDNPADCNLPIAKKEE